MDRINIIREAAKKIEKERAFKKAANIKLIIEKRKLEEFRRQEKLIRQEEESEISRFD